MVLHARQSMRLAAAALGVAALTGLAKTADAEQRRVVVVKFDGPRSTAKQSREAVLDVLDDHYEVLPYSKYRIARRRLNVRTDSMKSVAKIAQRIGADAVVNGSVDGGKLNLVVREGRSGRVVDRFVVAAGQRGLSDDARDRLTDELVDLIDWTEPVGPAAAPEDEKSSPTAQASLAAAEKAPPTWAIDAVDRADAEDEADARPSAVRVGAGVGIIGTARILQFVAQPDLDEEERPVQMSGAPAAAIAVVGTLDILPLGLSAEISYQRSVGASLAYPDGGQTKKLAIAHSHLGGRISAARDVGKRYNIRASAGYGQLSYAVKNKPNGLILPDSRYAYASIGAGAKARFRDDRVALSAEIDYMHVLSAGGITAETAYGTAAARGVRGYAGVEIQASATSFIRLGVQATQITLAFHGNGTLATSLDEDSDVDVSGASDTFIGGLGMVGFHF